MWGNRLGWMISAGIMAVTIVLYTILLLGPSVTAPTELTTRAGAMDALVLPGNAKGLVVAGGGSADAYQRAIDLYKADTSTFDRFADGGKLNTPEFKTVKPAIDLLVEAAGSTGGPFAKNPGEIVRYNPDQTEHLNPVYQLGRIANLAGQKYNIAKQPDQAKKCLQAGYALGYAMCYERLVYHEFRMGQELMRNASLNLTTIDKSKAAEYKAIDAQYRPFFESMQKYMFLFNPSDERMIAKNAGDVFNLAQNGQERMYRIEAIMMLGHFRYYAAQAGDQRGADAVLAKMALDSSLDPAVLAAVKVAQSLTIAQHGNSQQMP